MENHHASFVSSCSRPCPLVLCLRWDRLLFDRCNPTPELINESQRDIDIMRNEMVMDNINERMLNGDIRRFWLRTIPAV